MNDKIKNYLDNHENLPDFMKDFHDQKDLFKTIYDQFSGSHPMLDEVSWVQTHQITVDLFLWWMGIHGYKLQKIRKSDIEFEDPIETIKYFTELRSGRSVDIFNKILNNNENKS